ncbi:hypothetical protein KP509_33G050300 [Ceratopteris richardii]|uniref:Uncharacterized protein n=1 Tax=Ceratopteris richardii TaxID=49495 RepID=A0A8T2QQL6_CERRI|nr:hypothetical protein KP509_33G050300 [Ceratopteris richardii]
MMNTLLQIQPLRHSNIIRHLGSTSADRNKLWGGLLPNKAYRLLTASGHPHHNLILSMSTPIYLFGARESPRLHFLIRITAGWHRLFYPFNRLLHEAARNQETSINRLL